MTADDRSGKADEPAHDVLAAEEFPLGAADPRLHDEPPHDILAAEMFEVGAADPVLHHGPVQLPPDLTGSPQPVDVLAAEEFAIPAPVPHVFATPDPYADVRSAEAAGSPEITRRAVHVALLAAVAAAIAAVLVRGRRRRGG